MAFIRKTYNCNDVLTDEDMNNIMEGIEEAMNSGGDCGCGTDFSCVASSWEQVFNGTVSTDLAEGEMYYGAINYNIPRQYVPQYRITFDGTVYENVRVNTVIVSNTPTLVIGANLVANGTSFIADWSEYPFAIANGSLATKDSGSHTLTIEEASSENVYTRSRCFFNAVWTVIDEARAYNPLWASVEPYTSTGIVMKSFNLEIHQPWLPNIPNGNTFDCQVTLETDADTSYTRVSVSNVTPSSTWEGTAPAQSLLDYLELLVADYFEKRKDFFFDNWSLVEANGMFNITLL